MKGGAKIVIRPSLLLNVEEKFLFDSYEDVSK